MVTAEVVMRQNTIEGQDKLSMNVALLSRYAMAGIWVVKVRTGLGVVFWQAVKRQGVVTMCLCRVVARVQESLWNNRAWYSSSGI